MAPALETDKEHRRLVRLRNGLYCLAFPLSNVVLGALAFAAYWVNAPFLLWGLPVVFLAGPCALVVAALVVMQRAERRKTQGWYQDDRLELLKLSTVTVSLSSFVLMLFLTAVLFDVGRDPSRLVRSLVLTGLLGGLVLVGHLSLLWALKEEGTGVERIVTRDLEDVHERLSDAALSDPNLFVNATRRPLTRKIGRVEARTPHGTIRLWRDGRSRTRVNLLSPDWRILAEACERLIPLT